MVSRETVKQVRPRLVRRNNRHGKAWRASQKRQACR